jgi:HK97 family phage portal protein
MAWNSRQTKDLGGNSQQKAGTLGPGAPVALHPAMAGKPYRDSWDIERAYREGLQKVVWVSRCIDAIAGNQARLPVILRKDNNPDGEVYNRKHRILDLLNTKSNEGENSFVFRYRLSSQLLMSTRGAFIEKVTGRDGGIIALNLLPPQFTAPLPDPKRFVAGYQVDLPTGQKFILPPEKVVWVRRPHPLDPYLSLTPMESAGIAIEIENLARLYNRNFLLNDGRPGGLLVVRGELDPDDADELRSRFRGNLSRTGHVSVISSEDGADFIDTASNPRDASYTEMRQITKEEILAAFGVPESVIGNASGRTFSNAAEELRVFWMETMLPHLEPLARSLDELDDKFYIDFDTKDVPILILSKQERERYLMEEYGNGLISANEYREGTGRKKLESEIADQLLSNPNLVPIANTEKPFSIEDQSPIAEGGAVTGAGGEMGAMPGAPGQEQLPAAPGAEQQPGMEQVPPADGQQGGMAPEATIEPIPEGQLSERQSGIQTKILNQALDVWDLKAEQSADRWTEILDASLDRLFERQQRVILEKALGAKSRKAIKDQTLSIDAIFDVDVWNRQMEDDLRPLLKAVAIDAATLVSENVGEQQPVSEKELDEFLDAQVQRVQQANETTKEELAAALLVVMALSGSDDEKASMLRAALIAIFVNLLSKRKRTIAEHESQTAFNAGTYLGSLSAGLPRKKWLTRRDIRVREAHKFLDGKSVEIDKGFAVDGSVLRFPGDPLAPPSLTINCRCRLRFDL